MTELKHFSVDHSRTQLVVPLELYQFDLSAVVKQVKNKEPDLFENGNDALPSWSKFVKDPYKAKSLWTRLLQSMFLGQNNLPQLDIDYQTRDASIYNVSMIFLPESTRNNSLGIISALTKQVLVGWQVLQISGNAKHNDKRITNKNSEAITKEVIAACKKENKPLVIISRGMAQRSYSVPDITNIILCFDNGDAGATTQKISRSLTPATKYKVGRIFSLSFDPTRDDKFDTMFLSAASNLTKKHSIDIGVAIRMLIGTIDVFSSTADGRVKITPDEYIKHLLSHNRLSRTIAKHADINRLSDHEKQLILNRGFTGYTRVSSSTSCEKGTTYASNNNTLTKPDRKRTKHEKARIMQSIVTMIEYLPYLKYTTGASTLSDSLAICEKDSDYREFIESQFGLTPAMIRDLFKRNILNYDLATLQPVKVV